MTAQETTRVTACSVAGGGWLIRVEDRTAEWVDAAACRSACPEETARIAALGRALILGRRPHAGALLPAEIAWLLAAPRRIACLVDFLAAPEEWAWVQSWPLFVSFAASGEVRWRFGGSEAAPGGGSAPPRGYRWPMAQAAENRRQNFSQVSMVGAVGATKG